MNESASSLKVCGRCGASLPANAPEGLCPRCLGALNLTGETAFTETEAPRIPPPSPEQIATHFPQLEILECLGRGGMGVVYKARQKSLGRFVALKLLAPEREKDPQFAERFAREAQALAQLNHPHIVTVYDFGRTNGFFYLLMEFVDGVSLRELLRARKLTPKEALAIVPPLCEALQFAHERGIVHRDIKPENLLLDKGGQVKVADFGIAKMLGGEASAEEENIAGTPGYMAPEQKARQQADGRADIYSLGVVFYEMLTGELPTQKLERPSRKVAVDVRIDEVVLRALEKSPELRWQTAAELGTRVETIASGPPVRAWHPQRQRKFWFLALPSAVALLGVNIVILNLLRAGDDRSAFVWLRSELGFARAERKRPLPVRRARRGGNARAVGMGAHRARATHPHLARDPALVGGYDLLPVASDFPAAHIGRQFPACSAAGGAGREA
jgi:predicted Ser/Thr protein kinase